MWQSYGVETSMDRQEVARFLGKFNLHYDFDSEHTVEVRQNGAIVATGSLKGSVLQCFAVDKALQGEGLAIKVVDHLVEEALALGKTRVFVFTSPGNVGLFKSMGFKVLADTAHASLLETGYPAIADYMRSLSELRIGMPEQRIGGLVMNCNPFTLGHQYLVERAAAVCDHVFLLVVEEDRSVFPFKVRYDLVKRGTSHLSNVTVVASGPYAVSLATFPSYFSAEETAHARAGASVDATVYGAYIAKALGVSLRFVGTEPYSPVTAIYNETLREVLAKYGIVLIEIKRVEQAGRAVSASLVRKSLREGDLAALTALVPKTTLDYLYSEEARGIVDKLKKSMGRH